VNEYKHNDITSWQQAEKRTNEKQNFNIDNGNFKFILELQGFKKGRL
jgi:hypothetical protein